MCISIDRHEEEIKVGRSSVAEAHPETVDLDILILSSYAPGHSRHNPIERSWAPLSKWLTGITHDNLRRETFTSGAFCKVK